MKKEDSHGDNTAIKTEREKRIYVAPSVDVRKNAAEGTETASNRV